MIGDEVRTPAAADVPKRVLDAFPLSAASFVVTLYGDLVAPRGGELWTGNIVETLSSVGIAEPRVRTALSRLVAAGRLEGTKSGRRSYYRLTPPAAEEFSNAARLIYAPAPAPLRGWHLVAMPETGREAATAALKRLRFGFVTPQLAVLPNRGTPLPRLPGYLFSAVTDDDLGALLRGAWPLAALAERMRYFIDRFELLGSDNLRSPAALGLRLILVHAFRELALRDPLLPPALLPSDWPGAEVRALFARLYLGLSPETDAIIAAQFTDRFGPLHPDLARIEERLNCLRTVTIDGGTVTANCRN